MKSETVYRKEAPEPDVKEISLDEFRSLVSRTQSDGGLHNRHMKAYSAMNRRERQQAPDRCICRERNALRTWICLDTESAKRCDLPIKGWPIQEKHIERITGKMLDRWKKALTVSTQSRISEHDMAVLNDAVALMATHLADMRNPDDKEAEVDA